jgi:hypothetical protein
LIALQVHAQKTGKKPARTVSIVKFIPGLYQLKKGKYFKGTLLLGSFVGTLTGTFIYNKKGNDWYDKYQNSTNVEDIVLFRQHTEKSFKRRNLCIVGIFSVWLIHVLDLKFFKTEKAGISGNIGKKKFNFGIYYAF